MLCQHEYPERALREAIANAIMHRDWFIDGANVFVEIYADRIEVVSPGGLPPGLPHELFGRKSVRQNPLIADLLQRISFIERAGTGVGRMRGAAIEHGTPPPVFHADAFFTSTFYPLRSAEFAWLAKGHVGGQERGHEHGHEVQKPASEEPLGTLEILLLRTCANGASSRTQLMEAGGFTTRTGQFQRALAGLLGRGLLEMTCPDQPRSRHQRYRPTPRGRQTIEAIESLNG